MMAHAIVDRWVRQQLDPLQSTTLKTGAMFLGSACRLKAYILKSIGIVDFS